MRTGTEYRTWACTKVPRCKLDVNIELRVSAAFHSSQVTVVHTEEQDQCDPKMDSISGEQVLLCLSGI